MATFRSGSSDLGEWGVSPYYAPEVPDPGGPNTSERRRTQPVRPASDLQPGRHRLQWPTVADDLFYVAHDGRGVTVLHPDVLSLALGAALVAELVLGARLDIGDDGRLKIFDATPVPDDLAQTVLRHVQEEREPLTLRDWIAYLGRTSTEQVAARMSRAGKLQPYRRRTLRTLGLGTTTLYPPVDQNNAAWPWIRISTSIRRFEEFDLKDAVLAGLILATDLHRLVLSTVDGDVEGHLRRRVAVAPWQIRELLATTETAVGDRVIVG